MTLRRAVGCYMKPMRWILGLLVAVTTSYMGATAVFAAEGDEMALAERVAAMADHYDNSGAYAPLKSQLYDAAGRLAEREVRFRRMRFRAAENAGDNEMMLLSLLEWRKLEPDNLFVQARLIDVYLGRMETADARLAYLRQVIDAESVHREVRSHAAVQAAALYLEQSREQQALEQIRRALSLNILNVDALQMQWQLALHNSSPLQRVNLLLALLKANPASLNAVIHVAEELADANMVNDSLQWYAHAAGMAKSMGGLNPPAARDHAAELLISGDDRGAAAITSRLLEKDSNDAAAWFLTLLAERQMKDRFDQVRNNALVGLLNRLALQRKAIGVKGATTRPLDTEDTKILDISSDVDLLKKAEPAVREEYIAAVNDIVWLLVYHDSRVQDAQALLKVITAVKPEDKVTLARLEGWTLLKSGKNPEARTRLVSEAEHDSLCALGVILVDRKDPALREKASEAARNLIVKSPSRLVGAIIHAEIADLAGNPPATQLSDALHDSLDRFPKEVLRLAVAPYEFLAMRFTPSQVGHDVGEPMLVEIELRNIQDVPLVIGPEGMVRDVWIDAQTRGLVQQAVPGVLLEKTDGPVVLPAGGTVRWMTRLDRGPLADLLDQNVAQVVQVQMLGMTNAVPSDTGIVPGPCGIRSRMNQMLERRPANLQSESYLRHARETLEGSDALAKIRLVDVIAAHMHLMQAADATPSLKALEPELREMFNRLSRDSVASVRLWARYRMATEKVEPAENIVAELAKDSLWYGRVLAVMEANELPDEPRTRLLGVLKNDADATVRRLALAAASMPMKPATQAKPVEAAN